MLLGEPGAHVACGDDGKEGSCRTGAASSMQLLSRELAPGICVCFGCTLRAEVVGIQSSRGKEGRERRGLGRFQT